MLVVRALPLHSTPPPALNTFLCFTPLYSLGHICCNWCSLPAPCSWAHRCPNRSILGQLGGKLHGASSEPPSTPGDGQQEHWPVGGQWQNPRALTMPLAAGSLPAACSWLLGAASDDTWEPTAHCRQAELTQHTSASSPSSAGIKTGAGVCEGVRGVGGARHPIHQVMPWLPWVHMWVGGGGRGDGGDEHEQA